jgi:hypothetical protein
MESLRVWRKIPIRKAHWRVTEGTYGKVGYLLRQRLGIGHDIGADFGQKGSNTQ